MARINIEDSIWKDNRFQDLMIKVGNRHAAKGMVLELWSLAQEYWFPEKKYIPLDRIKQAGLDVVIEVGLAEEKDGGIFAVGTDKAFEWLFQRQEAGKKGGRPKATAKRPKAVVKVPKAGDNREKAEQSGSNPLTLSLTLSPSLSSSSFSDSEISKEAAEPNAGAFIAAYCREWKSKYGSRPEITGKERGIAKRLCGFIGTERACNLVEAFFRMQNQWFLTKRHDLATFEQNLNAVVQFHDTGTQITQGQARAAEGMAHAQDQLRRIAEGSL